MNDELDEALESARSTGLSGDGYMVSRRPLHSRVQVAAIVRAVLQGVPEDMTAHEILAEIEGE